jgi:hypothetical protein
MATWNAIHWTPEMDAEIVRVYTQRVRSGNKRLALTWGIRPRAISARAGALGVPPLCRRSGIPQHGWKDEEMELVAEHLGEPIAQLRARLYRQGYARSEGSIRGLLQRMRASGEWPGREAQIEDQDALTVPAVCAGLGVGDWQIYRWIRQGWLRSRTLGGDGMRKITRTDLKRFLIDYAGHWDHRLADKYFLIDALTYRRTGLEGRREAA